MKRLQFLLILLLPLIPACREIPDETVSTLLRDHPDSLMDILYSRQDISRLALAIEKEEERDCAAGNAVRAAEWNRCLAVISQREMDPGSAKKHLRKAARLFREAGETDRADREILALAKFHGIALEPDSAAFLLRPFLQDPVHPLRAQAAATYAGALADAGTGPPDSIVFYYREAGALSFHDRIRLSRALRTAGRREDAEKVLEQAGAMASNGKDSAYLAWFRAENALSDKRFREASAHLLRYARAQDSLYEATLTRSLYRAEKEYYRQEAATRRAEAQRNRLLGFMALLLGVSGSGILIHRVRRQRRAIEAEMARSATALRDLTEARCLNGTLLGDLFLRRIASLNLLSESYFNADEKSRKEQVYKSFVRELEAFRTEDARYRELEAAINRYEGGAIAEVRKLYPRIKDYQVRRLCLFFAGVPYSVISALTKDSVACLKEGKSRFRKQFLALGTATGNQLADLLDGPIRLSGKNKGK